MLRLGCDKSVYVPESASVIATSHSDLGGLTAVWTPSALNLLSCNGRIVGSIPVSAPLFSASEHAFVVWQPRVTEIDASTGAPGPKPVVTADASASDNESDTVTAWPALRLSLVTHSSVIVVDAVPHRRQKGGLLSWLLGSGATKEAEATEAQGHNLHTVLPWSEEAGDDAGEFDAEVLLPGAELRTCAPAYDLTQRTLWSAPAADTGQRITCAAATASHLLVGRADGSLMAFAWHSGSLAMQVRLAEAALLRPVAGSSTCKVVDVAVAEGGDASCVLALLSSGHAVSFALHASEAGDACSHPELVEPSMQLLPLKYSSDAAAGGRALPCAVRAVRIDASGTAFAAAVGYGDGTVEVLAGIRSGAAIAWHHACAFAPAACCANQGSDGCSATATASTSGSYGGQCASASVVDLSWRTHWRGITDAACAPSIDALQAPQPRSAASNAATKATSSAKSAGAAGSSASAHVAGALPGAGAGAGAGAFPCLIADDDAGGSSSGCGFSGAAVLAVAHADGTARCWAVIVGAAATAPAHHEAPRRGSPRMLWEGRRCLGDAADCKIIRRWARQQMAAAPAPAPAPASAAIDAVGVDDGSGGGSDGALGPLTAYARAQTSLAHCSSLRRSCIAWSHTRSSLLAARIFSAAAEASLLLQQFAGAAPRASRAAAADATLSVTTVAASAPRLLGHAEDVLRRVADGKLDFEPRAQTASAVKSITSQQHDAAAPAGSTRLSRRSGRAASASASGSVALSVGSLHDLSTPTPSRVHSNAGAEHEAPVAAQSRTFRLVPRAPYHVTRIAFAFPAAGLGLGDGGGACRNASEAFASAWALSSSGVCLLHPPDSTTATGSTPFASPTPSASASASVSSRDASAAGADGAGGLLDFGAGSASPLALSSPDAPLPPLSWSPVPRPEFYCPSKAPLRLAAAAPDGAALAVAGNRGAAVYLARRGAWHVFSTPSQEAALCAGALAWLTDRVLLVLNKMPLTPHAAVGPDSTAAASGGAGRAKAAASRDAHSASCRWELRAYPRARLDASSMLCSVPMLLPAGTEPAALSTAVTRVLIPDAAATAASGAAGAHHQKPLAQPPLEARSAAYQYRSAYVLWSVLAAHPSCTAAAASASDAAALHLLVYRMRLRSSEEGASSSSARGRSATCFGVGSGSAADRTAVTCSGDEPLQPVSVLSSDRLCGPARLAAAAAAPPSARVTPVDAARVGGVAPSVCAHDGLAIDGLHATPVTALLPQAADKGLSKDAIAAAASKRALHACLPAYLQSDSLPQLSSLRAKQVRALPAGVGSTPSQAAAGYAASAAFTTSVSPAGTSESARSRASSESVSGSGAPSPTAGAGSTRLLSAAAGAEIVPLRNPAGIEPQLVAQLRIAVPLPAGACRWAVQSVGALDGDVRLFSQPTVVPAAAASASAVGSAPATPSGAASAASAAAAGVPSVWQSLAPQVLLRLRPILGPSPLSPSSLPSAPAPQLDSSGCASVVVDTASGSWFALSASEPEGSGAAPCQWASAVVVSPQALGLQPLAHHASAVLLLSSGSTAAEFRSLDSPSPSPTSSSTVEEQLPAIAGVYWPPRKRYDVVAAAAHALVNAGPANAAAPGEGFAAPAVAVAVAASAAPPLPGAHSEPTAAAAAGRGLLVRVLSPDDAHESRSGAGAGAAADHCAAGAAGATATASATLLKAQRPGPALLGYLPSLAGCGAVIASDASMALSVADDGGCDGAARAGGATSDVSVDNSSGCAVHIVPGAPRAVQALIAALAALQRHGATSTTAASDVVSSLRSIRDTTAAADDSTASRPAGNAAVGAALCPAVAAELACAAAAAAALPSSAGSSHGQAQALAASSLRVLLFEALETAVALSNAAVATGRTQQQRRSSSEARPLGAAATAAAISAMTTPSKQPVAAATARLLSASGAASAALSPAPPAPSAAASTVRRLSAAALTSPSPSPSPSTRFEYCGVPIEAEDGLSAASLTMLRRLCVGLREYAAASRVPIGAVLDDPSAGGAGRGWGFGGFAGYDDDDDEELDNSSSTGPAAPDRTGGKGGSAQANAYLCAVLAALQAADASLGAVAAVGRTVEEHALPTLFAAAGPPRLLLREALARAAVEAVEAAASAAAAAADGTSSGSVASKESAKAKSKPSAVAPEGRTRLHGPASVRLLRTAAALMLLAQEHDWRRAAARATAEAREAAAAEQAKAAAAAAAAAAAKSKTPGKAAATARTTPGKGTGTSTGSSSSAAAGLASPFKLALDAASGAGTGAASDDAGFHALSHEAGTQLAPGSPLPSQTEPDISPAAAVAIVNANLADAEALLSVIGLPSRLVKALTGGSVPLPGARDAAAAASAGAATGEPPSPAPAPLSDEDAEAAALLAIREGGLVDWERDPASEAALLAIIEGTHAYCRRLRGAAQDFCAAAATAAEAAAARADAQPSPAPAAASAAATAEAGETAPAASAGGGGGGWGFLSSVASFLGLASSDGAVAADAAAEAEASTSAVAASSGSGAQAAAANSGVAAPAGAGGGGAAPGRAGVSAFLAHDPVLRVLRRIRLPLLVRVTARLSRLNSGSGGFGLRLVEHSPLDMLSAATAAASTPAATGAGSASLSTTSDSAQAAALAADLSQAAASAPGDDGTAADLAAVIADAEATAARAAADAAAAAASGGAGPSSDAARSIGSPAAEAATVADALARAAQQQRGWLLAQLLDATVRVQGFSGGVPPSERDGRSTLRPGDALVSVDGVPLAGRSMEEAVGAVSAAAKVAEFTVHRVVAVPVMRIMAALMQAQCQAQSQAQR